MERDLWETCGGAFQKHIRFHESQSNLEKMRADLDPDGLVNGIAPILWG